MSTLVKSADAKAIAIAPWKKGSRSADANGGCVYMAPVSGQVNGQPATLIGVTDQDGPNGDPQLYTKAEIVEYFRAIKAGEFDHLIA